MHPDNATPFIGFLGALIACWACTNTGRAARLKRAPNDDKDD
jgi:hypothetical protein